MAFSLWRMFVFERAPRLHTANAGKATGSTLRREEGAGLKYPVAYSFVSRGHDAQVPGLAERYSKQARAKQHEAGCGYREEAFCDEVIVTHDAPAERDAGPNLLKLSESFPLQHRPRTIALISVRNENAGADEAEKCCNCLDHRICP